MNYFTLNETNIALHDTHDQAKATGDPVFTNEVGFADAAGNNMPRLVEIWNSMTDVRPVRKFENRHIATGRIWREIQKLAGANPEAAAEPATDTSAGAQGADVAPEAAAPTKDAKPPKKAPRTPKPAKDAATPRAGSKTERAIAMLRRKNGATLEQLMTEFGWLKHTTRAFLSAGGSLTKKFGLAVESFKGNSGERTYMIAS